MPLPAPVWRSGGLYTMGCRGLGWNPVWPKLWGRSWRVAWSAPPPSRSWPCTTPPPSPPHWRRVWRWLWSKGGERNKDVWLFWDLSVIWRFWELSPIVKPRLAPKPTSPPEIVLFDLRGCLSVVCLSRGITLTVCRIGWGTELTAKVGVTRLWHNDIFWLPWLMLIEW